MGKEHAQPARDEGSAAPAAEGQQAGVGPVAYVAGLQRAAGNRAVTSLLSSWRLQRQDPPSGGMSSNQGTSTTAPGGNVSTPGPADVAGRKRIDEAKNDFSQRAFRNIEPEDWVLARDDEKIQLLDRAVAKDLLWVGDDDEAAIDACWRSFDASKFDGVVKAHPAIWERCVDRGAHPERIPATKGRHASLKTQAVEVANQHLTDNRNRLLDEMDKFGLTPPPELARDPTAAKPGARTDVGAQEIKPEIKQRLKDQQEVARVVIKYQRHLDEMRKTKVGREAEPFNPARPPVMGDWEFIPGVSTWQMVLTPWTRISAKIGEYLSAYPALYAANLRGRLDELANPAPTDVQQEMHRDAGAVAGLKATQDLMESTLRDIAKTRVKLGEDSDAYLDLTPVHKAMWAGAILSPAGQPYTKEVMKPILDDERAVNDDIEAAKHFAVDAGLFILLVAGSVGTMGGAALAVGVAAARAMGAQEKAAELGAAYGANISDKGALVSAEQVTAAQATAHDKLMDVLMTVVMEAQGGLSHAVTHQPPASAEAGLAGRYQQAAAAGEEGAVSSELRMAQLGAPAARAGEAAAGTPSAKQFWEGIAPAQREAEGARFVNTTLRTKGVPDVVVVAGDATHFDFHTWEIQIERPLFGDGLTAKQNIQLRNIVFHEPDHTELWYQIARAKAPDYRTAEELAHAMEFTGDRARAAGRRAFAEPMPHTDPRRAEMLRHFENIYGAGKNNRDQVLADLKELTGELGALQAEETRALREAEGPLRTKAERDAAREKWNLARLDRRRKAREYQDHYRVYESMDEEARAFATERRRELWLSLSGPAAERRGLAEAELEGARREVAKYEEVGANQAVIDDARVRVAVAAENLEAAEAELAEAHRVMQGGQIDDEAPTQRQPATR